MSTYKVFTEKGVLSDMLKKYKEMPCLWNTTHQYYTNKNKRQEYYEQLLDIYKIYINDAHVSDVRRKLEYMRTTYKREYAKVTKARMKGEVYTPTLWYYNLLTFLDEPPEEENDAGKETEDIEEDEEEEDNMRITDSPVRTPIPDKKRKIDVEFIEEDSNEYSIKTEEDTRRPETSAETFGRSIGMQLNELHPMQRFIAEKLISDVIFLARMEKLQAETKIQGVSDKN